MGLDAVGWAKEGLIDLLVATPRWATTGVRHADGSSGASCWAASKVTLAGGLEVLYRPCPGGEANGRFARA